MFFLHMQTTPLHAAASAGHCEIVAFLVVKGAVIDCKGVKIGQQDKKVMPCNHIADDLSNACISIFFGNAWDHA